MIEGLYIMFIGFVWSIAFAVGFWLSIAIVMAILFLILAAVIKILDIFL